MSVHATAITRALFVLWYIARLGIHYLQWSGWHHRDLALIEIHKALAFIRIWENWAESGSTLLKNGAIVCFHGNVKKMAPSFCWHLKLSTEVSFDFVKIRQETTKLGRNVLKKSLESLRGKLESLRAEYIAVCMQRWSIRRRSLSWKTSFNWSELKMRAFPGVCSHPAVRSWPWFQIQKTPADFAWFFMRTKPAVENRGALLNLESLRHHYRVKCLNLKVKIG